MAHVLEPGRLGGLRGLIDRISIEHAIEIVVGRPELVTVDARVLRLLMGDLANLIILGETMRFNRGESEADQDQEQFVWDEDSPCN